VRFQDRSVTPVRVGLDRVGVVGLHEALKETDSLDPEDRETVVERMMAVVGPRNYVPEAQLEAFRTALWREFLRHRGRDFSPWYSALPVTVRGAPGAERERFAALVREVLAKEELRPELTFTAAEGPLELVIRDEVVARGALTRGGLERALRATFSHW
jgi:hypothetical protein